MQLDRRCSGGQTLISATDNVDLPISETVGIKHELENYQDRDVRRFPPGS
jgi:hypothetical protein